MHKRINIIDPMVKKLGKYIDLKYAFKILLLIPLFYYFNIFYLGLTTMGGEYYSSFLDHYANYIKWMSTIILVTAQFLLSIPGYSTVIENDNIIRMIDGPGVQLWLPCLGLGIMSFWIAYIISFHLHWKVKIFWGTIGILTVMLVNCFRIAFLLIALHQNMNINRVIDHHTLFNIVAYLFMIILIVVFNKQMSKVIK